MPAPRFYTKPKSVPVAQRRFARGLGYYSAADSAAMAKAKTMRVARRNAAMAANPLGSVIAMIQQGLPTQAQAAATARASVNAQIAAEQLAIKNASREAADQAFRQAQASEGFSKALLGFAASDRAAIEQAYGAQAGALSSLGASLGGAMTGAENAALAASQADVDRLAPGGAVPAYIPTGEGAGSVAGITGDAATALSTMGGGYSREALGRALASGIEGRDLADRYRAQGLDVYKDQVSKIAELQATRPKLYADALAASQASRNQQLATLLSALSLQSGNAQDVASAKLASQKYQTTVAENKRDALKDMGMDQFGNPLPGNYRDPRTGRIMELPSGTVIGPKGMPVKLVTPKGKDAKKAKQPSLTDWAKTRERMMNEGAARLGIAEDSKGKIEFGWSLKNIQQYIRRYAADFKNTFGDYPQLESMVNEVANTLFNQLKQRRRSAGQAPAATGGAKTF